ncbi:MAG: nuclear transport factor 2 family protein [Gemmatimonadota bacterium]
MPVRLGARWLLLAFLATPLAAQTPPPAPVAEEASVRTTINEYLHGLKFNDIRSFERTFTPDARLMFINRSGQIGQLTQSEWYRGFASVAGKEEPGEFEVLAIDITGNAASVKVRETYPKSVYVNYLSLLKVGTEWKIVNKIYTSRPR